MSVVVPNPTPGLGYGGFGYGISGLRRSARPLTPAGGYGGRSYGLYSYGSVDAIPPRVTSANSLTGTTLEVFFSEPMRIDAALLLAASYSITPVIGAPATVISVARGVLEDGGASSVILTHTGTTLGGSCTVLVAATVRDVTGNLILPSARSATCFTLGVESSFSAEHQGGSHVLLTFSETLLSEESFSPGVGEPGAYGFETDYPVDISVTEVENPVEGDGSLVLLTVEGMTSVSYDVTVSPADAIVFDGSYLPSSGTTFEGASVGTGTSTAGAGGLLLTKDAGVSYGWSFSDTSGRVLPSSSYRVDVLLNASAAVYVPSLYDATLGTITISDGAVQIGILIGRVAGIDIVEVSSGGFFAQVPATWSSGPRQFTLVRNQKADHYALLVDGVPLVSSATSALTGVPSISPGVQFVLSGNYAVTQFPLTDVTFTSSQTVFSSSWNFLHGVTSTFTGSSALTRPYILTKRGPLVKDWGDATPATKADVEVRVNGVPVEVDSVNPYLGQITPTIPIPLTQVGATLIEVDYQWFANPALPMPGLNTLGVVLNKWDLHQGWHPPAVSPAPSSSVGVPDRQRFPMGFVLPPLHRQRPVQIGHRYIGFEKGYTAALNSPTTLLLNQNPNRISRDTLDDSPENIFLSYDGSDVPTAGGTWMLEGADTGQVESGYYLLVDEQTDSPGLYTHETDFSFPATGNMAARLQVQDWTLDGVYTGVGFGFHNDKFLYLAGFLEINGVKHVGMIRDATRPYLRASWVIGPAISIRITSPTTFTTTSASFTTASMQGDGVRFQIFDGSQAGVYEVAECGFEVDGDTTTVTLAAGSSFPANPSKWGNSTAVAYVEVRWDAALTTYRITADVADGSAQMYVGGAFSGLAVSIARVAAFPAQTVLVLTTQMQGAVFWGSTSRNATNTSRWGFVRCGVTYDQATFHFKGIVVAAEMSKLPDADENHEWFITEDFGYGLIDSSGNTLLLKSTAGSEDSVLDTTYGYGRLEPFLTNQTLIDVDATFRIDSGVLGAGDAQVVYQNGERQVVFSSILYVEGGSPYRRLVQIPAVSITGIRDPVDDGWQVEGEGLTVNVLDLPLEFVQEDGAEQLFCSYLDTTSADLTNGRIMEARLRVVSYTDVGVGDGPIFGCTAGATFRNVALQFVTGGVQLVTLNTGVWDAVSAPVSFEWDDEDFHTYRLLVDPTTDTVVVVIDDTVSGSVALTSFTGGGLEGRAYFGAVTTSASTGSDVEWESFSVVGLPPITAKRTLGVLRNGGDRDDINGWEIPRTDSSTDANSTVSAVVEEMDWLDDVQVRIRLDPSWGVTIFRTDLPPPPYYTGEFATQYTEPSAGWINVEYRHLPRLTSTQRFGRVDFGALDARSITQQRWSQVRYRVYTRGDEDFIAPQHMVLNWYNVITSGELLRDTGAEVLTVESISTTLVSLVPTHVRAGRVFNVVVDGVVLGPSDWTFDRDTQAITLATPLASAHTNVTVTFVAGSPVTNTYLCSQPLAQSTTLLNEGTPPVPMSQVGSTTREEVFGTALNDPTDTLGSMDFILNDPFRTVQFTDDASVLYESLEFCTIDDGNDLNLLSPICDGPGPELGWIEIALSGTAFSDGLSLPGGPKAWGGSTVARDTVGGFNQSGMLTMSGGRPVTGGAIGGGTDRGTILYPSYPSIPGPDRGATIRSMHLTMRMSSALTDASVDPVVETALADDFDFASTATDNDPPESADPATDPNPSVAGAASGNGAAAAVMVDAVSTTYSRIGPWGGEVALSVRSQLAGGGMPLSGMGFTLAGGASLGPSPTTTLMTLKAAN